MAAISSRLLPIGLVLLVLAFVIPVGLTAIDTLLGPVDDPSGAQLLFVGTIKMVGGLLQILFFLVGLSCTIIGGLRMLRGKGHAAEGQR